MARIIPGVEVSVAKEVAPPQLAPSGVLGIVGIAASTSTGVQRAASWSRLIDLFGPSVAYTLPEARQALENGVYELVVSPVAESDKAKAAVGGLKCTARAAGSWANGYTLKTDKVTKTSFDLSVLDANGKEQEKYRNLEIIGADAPEGKVKIQDILKAQSAFIALDAEPTALPTAAETKLTGGKDPRAADYKNALAALELEKDVDMVLASLSATVADTDRVQVYSDVISHCNQMSKDSKPRIGFGQLPLNAGPKEGANAVSNLVSDRFVLLTGQKPVVGAVAGRVGGLKYYQSPTFKTVAGLGAYPAGPSLSDQRAYLKAHVVPVVNERGRGVIVLRGLTTDGEQISVRRVADRAVRGTKQISELFIGRLNTEDGRGALKQKLNEFFVQMEKENAIVPSTDGSDPAFKLDVYSSQADFAKGIVRVELAVRPVRAIDYIYASILVQV